MPEADRLTVLHRDILRVPMLSVSIAGASVNLLLLWKAQRLRNAPAAAWRKQPLKNFERWKIGVVLAASLLALGLSAMEIYVHRLLHHTLI